MPSSAKTTEWTGLRGKIGAWILDNPLRYRREAEFLAAIFQHIRGSEVVLDVGAGGGYYSLRIAEKLTAGKVIALDLSEEMLAHLKSRAERKGLTNRVHTLRADASSSGLDDRSVDLAISNVVLHELSDPESVLRELARVLKPGGLALIKDFDADTLKGRIIRLFHHGDAHGPFSARQLEELFRQIGFHDVVVTRKKGFLLAHCVRQ
jgi:ubiquinone/menaquinone biosynthesis C-methylase UbiE